MKSTMQGGTSLLKRPIFPPPLVTYPLSSLTKNHLSLIRVCTISKTLIQDVNRRTVTRTRKGTLKPQIRASSENNQVTTSSTSVKEETLLSAPIDSASDVVRKFYGGINCQDLDSVKDFIAENCVYEDLVFPRPFVGRKAILEFFSKFIDSISKDLQFVIDDISEEDSFAVGVTWHLEWQGRPFPFSKGCSFYRLELVNGKRQIIYGRDSVEPSIKPGETALVAIRGVTWLLQRFPQLANQL